MGEVSSVSGAMMNGHLRECCDSNKCDYLMFVHAYRWIIVLYLELGLMS